MTVGEFRNILEQEKITSVTWQGDNVFQGLKLIEGYLNPLEWNLITAAEHDIIYSVEVEMLINAGITEPDIKQLGRLNWMVWEDACLACFV